MLQVGRAADRLVRVARAVLEVVLRAHPVQVRIVLAVVPQAVAQRVEVGLPVAALLQVAVVLLAAVGQQAAEALRVAQAVLPADKVP
ncbi:MAG TPA: hypothetical protein VJS42_06470 [Steroidobacteraceae bacterium]|nr:hypothetical protein [Steroidobacteraceae bacterium]